MNKHLFFYFLPFLLFGSLVGCNKDDEGEPVDITAPTATEIRLNGEVPGAEITVAPGTELEFQATFNDDRELGKYRIEIHPDFDGHGHERIKSEDFEFIQDYDLSGTSQTVDEHIAIPDNATPGDYHFTVYYFDAASNEGELIVLDFIIGNQESQPAINIVSPDFDEEIESEAGQSIVLAGTVTDPDGLDEVHIILGHEDEGHDHGRLLDEEPLYEMEYELAGATTFNFEDADPILIPENTPPGHYELLIMAKDLLGNVSTKIAEVHID